MLDPVAVAPGHQGGVIGEPAGAVAVGPAAEVVQRLRQIPMVEAQPWLDAGLQHAVDQPVVEIQAGLVDGAACRAAARAAKPPRTGRPPPREPSSGDVFAIAMIMVAGDVAGVAVGDAALHRGSGYPRCWVAAPVLVAAPSIW